MRWKNTASHTTSEPGPRRGAAAAARGQPGAQPGAATCADVS
jgi:hypothetical protein